MSTEQNIRPLREPQQVPEKPQNDRATELPGDLFRRLEFSDELVGFHGGPQKKSGIKLALWTWLAAAVDTLILISMSCFFMMSFSFLMRTSFKKVVLMMGAQTHALQIFLFSFLMSFWVYLIFMRVFNGATIGEWTCHLRLGQPTQRLRVNYVLKVILRTTLIMLTGLVTLPLLSLIFKRDLAGDLSGVKIYSLK
jgi:hypothetical protein